MVRKSFCFSKEKINLLLLILIFIAINFQTYVIRSMVYSSEQMINYNFFFMIAAGILIIINFKNLDGKLMWMVAVLGILTFINLFANRVEIGNYIAFIYSILIPMLIVSINFKKNTIEKMFIYVVKIYSLLIYILLIFAIMDYTLKGELQLYIADMVKYTQYSYLVRLEHSWGIYRLYSFVGHPLTNTLYFLVFFCIKNVYYKFYVKKNTPYYITIISSIGIVLSGSKVGIVLFLFLVVFCANIKKNKWMYYVFIGIVILIIFNSSAFQENLVRRFEAAISRGDVTNGRYESFVAMIEAGYRPNFIQGNGLGYSRILTNSLGTVNFENPILMMAFDYGLLEVFIIYSIIFIYPMLILIRNNAYYIMTLYSVLFIYMNTNNGLANTSDSMARLCFLILIFINLSANKEQLREYKV